MSHTAHCFAPWRRAGCSCMDSQPNRGVEGTVRVRVIDRLSALVAHPKRLLVAIVALLVAAGAAVGSSAVLTSSSTNPGNSFHASNLDVTNDSSGVVVNVSGLHPGDAIPAKPITITNDGDLPASSMFLSSSVISATAPKGGPIASALTPTIPDPTDGGSGPVYNGPATPMTNEPIQLPGDPVTPVQDWSAGESRTYNVQLSFPSSSGNTFQLSTATIRYTWKASQ